MSNPEQDVRDETAPSGTAVSLGGNSRLENTTPEKNRVEGRKADQGKIPLDLLPTEALKEVGKVLAFGASKYASWNWKKGMAWSRMEAAALRHLFSFMEGEDWDPETGLSHLAHCACCILFLLSYHVLGLGTDDRWKNDEHHR